MQLETSRVLLLEVFFLSAFMAMPDSLPNKSPFWDLVRFLAAGVFLCLASLGIRFLMLQASPPPPLATIHPSKLSVEVRSLDLGKVSAADRCVLFVPLMNIGREPVKVIAAKGSCGCFAAAELPLTVQAGNREFLRLTLEPSTPATLGDQSYSIDLMTESTFEPLTFYVKLNREK